MSTKMKTPVWTALLGIHGAAQAVGERALVAYYTAEEFHVRRLESEIDQLEDELRGLRLVAQAARSRGEDVTAAPEGHVHV